MDEGWGGGQGEHKNENEMRKKKEVNEKQNHTQAGSRRTYELR